MVKNGTGAAARKSKLINLIEAGLIHSQSDAVLQLKKSGFKVTQATASRDLEEIGAVRARNSAGEMIYQLNSSNPVIRSNSNSLIISIESLIINLHSSTSFNALSISILLVRI